MAFMVLCQQAAVSLAQAVSALCRDVDTSVVVLPMFLETSRLFGGFFLAPALQKKWMVILDYLRCGGHVLLVVVACGDNWRPGALPGMLDAAWAVSARAGGRWQAGVRQARAWATTLNCPPPHGS
jgi:hypothetical protein